MFDWKPFLRRWSRELMTTDLAKRLNPPPGSPDWLGFEPATEAEVSALEERLGVILPPSYRSFLLTSNGWRRTTSFIGRLRPAAEVNWFRVENEQWVEVYADSGWEVDDEEYYDYSNGGAGHRASHMHSLLQISDVDDGVYLLNPEAVTPDGEWEAWFFANWVPGAERYPSFAHLMLHDYNTFRELEEVGGPTPPMPRLKTPAPRVPRVPAERLPKKLTKAPALESLIEQMRSTDPKIRDKAVRTFFGKLKGRPRANRRPDLVQPLVDLFRNSTNADVRSACISALIELAEDGAAPEALLDALSDPDPGVVLRGMSALHYFPDPRALEPLCRFLESDAHPLYKENAMSHLGTMGDERAIPSLVKMLFDTSNTFDQSFGTAGGALGRLGPEGFDALLPALDHPDPRVRLAAVVGIDTSGDRRAAHYLDRMVSDPDPDVRKRAAMRVGKLWP